MQWGAMGFEKVASAGGAVELPPGATAGMAVGLQIPPACPTIIGTACMRTEMTLSIHLTRASACGDGQWWRSSRRSLGMHVHPLLTGGTAGLVEETWKGW